MKSGFKWGLASILLLFAIALSMFPIAALLPRQILSVDVIVGSTVYHHWDCFGGSSPDKKDVPPDQTFIIRHRLHFYEDAPGYYVITIYWDCPENRPWENFTFVWAKTYFENGSPLENLVIFSEGPRPDNVLIWRYTVQVRNENAERVNEDFYVDILMRASGVGGTPHIAMDHPIHYAVIRAGEDEARPDPITVRVLSWTGTAMFELENLYVVSLEKNLDLYQGSKLVVRFYTYWDAFENESVIDNFVPPWHVEENEKVPHPTLPWCHKSAVKKARLDLTTDNTENVISTIASFTVRRIRLMEGYVRIDAEWPYASPERRSVLMKEIADIDLLWYYAPL